MTIISILDLGIIKYVSSNYIRFLNLTDYKDSCRTANKKQLAIKDKKNINLSIRDIILRLLIAFYVLGLMINFISIEKL